MVSESEEQLSEYIQRTMAFVISASFTIIYSYSFCSKSERKATKVNRSLSIICIVYVSSYTLRYFGTVVVFWMVGEDNIPSLINEILEYSLFDLAFVIGHFCFVLLIILRLQTGFKGTIYQPTKMELIMLYTLLFINLITNELYFVFHQNRKE